MNGKGIVIRGYRPGDEQGILATFNRVFREACGPGFVDRTLEQWNWQYLDNPEGQRITLAVDDEGTIASQYAGVPMLADTPWGCMRFVHCVDSMTHPDWRSDAPPGLFARTGATFGNECLERGEGLCFGFPIDLAFQIGRRFLGYRWMCDLDYLIRELDAGALPPPAATQVRTARVPCPPAEVDQLYDAVLAEKRCLVRRDHRYLRWRYVDNPDRRQYELVAAWRGDHLRGLLVLRPAHELVPDATTIVELLAATADADVRTALVAAAVQRQRELGRRRLLAVFPRWSAEWRALEGLGFAAVPSGTWLLRRLVHHIHSPRLSPEYLARNWWFTLGDSDLA